MQVFCILIFVWCSFSEFDYNSFFNRIFRVFYVYNVYNAVWKQWQLCLPFQLGCLSSLFWFLWLELPNNMSNKSDKSRHPCFVPHLRQGCLSFQLFNTEYDVSCGLVIWPFTVWSTSPLYSLYWLFLLQMNIEFCWTFSKSIAMIILFLSLILLI